MFAKNSIWHMGCATPWRPRLLAVALGTANTPAPRTFDDFFGRHHGLLIIIKLFWLHGKVVLKYRKVE